MPAQRVLIAPDVRRSRIGGNVALDGMPRMCKGSQNAQPTAMRTEILTSDREHVFHPFTVLGQHERTGALMIVEGSGSVVRDTDGREYIDGMAGLWCVNAGYSRARSPTRSTPRPCGSPTTTRSRRWRPSTPALLAERLLAMAPVPMSKVFFGSSGSDANDTQVKLVWFYNNALGRPAKKKIIARDRGYHGVTSPSAEPHRAHEHAHAVRPAAAA